MQLKTVQYPLKFTALALLAAPCAWVYFRYVWTWYLNKLGHVELWDDATSLYLLGLALHLMVIIPPYMQGELIFFGHPTGIKIGNGFWFIPNVGHLLIALVNAALLCRVVDVRQEEEELKLFDILRERWNALHLHIDTRDSHHIIHSNAGLFATGMFKLGQVIIGALKMAVVAIWTFFAVYHKGAKFETVSRLGFRLMLIAGVIAWWNNNPARYVEPIEFNFTIPVVEKMVKL